MSTFEFLSVLISVVVGLGITHLLTGVGRLLHHRGALRFDWIHLGWTLFVFLFLVIYWWTVVFGWREREDWNILLFLFILTYGVLLFLLCVVLYPVELSKPLDLREHFLGVRRWFFGIWIVTIFAELGDTFLKAHFDDLAAPYVPLIVSWIGTSALAWHSERRSVQGFVVLWHLVTFTAWVGIQLSDLQWAGPG